MLSIEKHAIDRRRFIKTGAMALIAGILPEPIRAFSESSLFLNRRLFLYNTHTGEKIETDYCIKGKYCPEALSAIDHILRDHRTEDACPMDVKLLDQLFTISKTLNINEPYHIISGYRSPTTNAMLCKIRSGVARNSYHIKGRAIDIRIPGVHLSQLKNTAIRMKAGGVGYYPKSDFIHLDSGPIRHW